MKSIIFKGTQKKRVFDKCIQMPRTTGLVYDEEIFMTNAKEVKEIYPIVDACKGIYKIKFHGFIKILLNTFFKDFVFELTNEFTNSGAKLNIKSTTRRYKS